jgi:PTS system mannose-specific IID component
VSTFLRSFLIQGSWNYRSMLGSGFAFAMLPGLRQLFGADRAALDESVDRHLEHFNAHPYLTNVALGAALRLEAEGAEPEMIRRFKTAVRGPLGSLGDTLVWATWLPGVALVALILYWVGSPAWLAVTAYLVLYNVLHIGLRVWGLRTGLSAGREVSRTLGKADISGWNARLQPLLAALLGVLAGVMMGGVGGLVDSGVQWAILAVVAFFAGALLGHRVWRPAAVATVLAVALIAAAGVAQ